MVEAKPGIDVAGLCFAIGSFRVDDLSLRVAKGEYLVLTGPNGAGKSVLLKLITGLYRPTAGRILVMGEDLTAAPPWERNIGYVPQEGTLFPNRTVRGNVEFGLEVRKVPAAQMRDRVDRVIEFVGIGHLQKRGTAGLSGGERQKVSLARALAFEPAVLLLDEPVSAIDEEARDSLCRELKRIQSGLGVTTIHVSHNRRETELVADRVAYLREGAACPDRESAYAAVKGSA